jgi:hypothetical protein
MSFLKEHLDKNYGVYFCDSNFKKKPSNKKRIDGIRYDAGSIKDDFDIDIFLNLFNEYDELFKKIGLDKIIKYLKENEFNAYIKLFGRNVGVRAGKQITRGDPIGVYFANVSYRADMCLSTAGGSKQFGIDLYSETLNIQLGGSDSQETPYIKSLADKYESNNQINLIRGALRVDLNIESETLKEIMDSVFAKLNIS